MRIKIKLFIFFVVFCFPAAAIHAQRDSTFIKSYQRVVDTYRKKGYTLTQDEDCGYIDFRRDIAYRLKFQKPVGKVNPREGGNVKVKEVTLVINDDGKVLKKRIRRFRLWNISG